MRISFTLLTILLTRQSSRHMSALHSFKMFNLISLVAATLAGCASPEAPMSADDAEYPILATQPDSKDKRPATTRLDALSRYFEEWKGTPYRWGGASKKASIAQPLRKMPTPNSSPIHYHALPVSN